MTQESRTFDEAWASGTPGSLRSSQLPAAIERALIEELPGAMGRGEIEVVFQPQFRCADDALVGAEALARWQHPTLGEIGARALFAIAEKARMVAPLSRRLVERALHAAGKWPGALSLSLNLTPEEIAEPDFASDFARLVARSGFAPERLTLEITEDVLLHDLDAAAAALAALKRVGLHLAIDDFGAGFCNFQYLRRLPLDTIKFDRSLVANLAQDPRDRAILRALVALAEALDLSVIAEGVETEEQLAVVRAEGCDLWQGFLRAEPMRDAAMLALARG